MAKLVDALGLEPSTSKIVCKCKSYYSHRPVERKVRVVYHRTSTQSWRYGWFNGRVSTGHIGV